MPTFEFKPQDPEEIKVTMTVTMTVKRWDEFAMELKKLGVAGGPVAWFISNSWKARMWARSHYLGEEEKVDGRKQIAE